MLFMIKDIINNMLKNKSFKNKNSNTGTLLVAENVEQETLLL